MFGLKLYLFLLSDEGSAILIPGLPTQKVCQYLVWQQSLPVLGLNQDLKVPYRQHSEEGCPQFERENWF